MLKQERIRSVDAIHFDAAWQLYINSFPHDERRNKDYQERTMLFEDYHFDILTENDAFVGFVLWWDFKKFVYIEHLATMPKERGRGLGKLAIERFFELKDNKTILLEVEIPEEEIQHRRINFYQRLGLKLNQQDYKHPAYHAGEDDVELLIMTYPNEISAHELADFCKTCHPIIHAETFNKK